MQSERLLQIFTKNNGIFSIQPRMAVKDNYSLALVYSPGVGSSCLEINKNGKQDGYVYTNKKNQILIMTDSSGFKNFNPNEWHNNIAIPSLETLSVYYKKQTNIDAFPLVLDYQLVQTADHLLEIIKQLSSIYSGFELYQVEPTRLEQLNDLVNQSQIESVIFTSIHRSQLNGMLDKQDLKISNLFISCILKASIDCRVWGILDSGVFQIISSNLPRERTLLALEIYSNAVSYFQNKKQNQIEVTDQITSFENFLIEGQSSQYKLIDKQFLHSEQSQNDISLQLHKRFEGMIGTGPKFRINDISQLDYLFNDNQIQAVEDKIKQNPDIANDITCKRNLCAIISNGTAILGFGDMGPLASLPVMEGKSVLFKQLGGTDVIPICVYEKNPEKFRLLIQQIAPIFNGINLEDIKAPECFEVERPLIQNMGYPIFHDDQHGTAMVVTAGLINALKVAKKDIQNIKIVMNGGGAAGQSIAELILHCGAKHITVCDTSGAIYKGRPKNMNKYKDQLAEITNLDQTQGSLADLLKDADVFIGVSAPNVVSKEMVRSMKKDPIIFALANPIPEIFPADAYEAGALIVATGRSDFPNQVNNSLVFPGLFRALIDTRAKYVTREMQVAAAYAVANTITDQEINASRIIPNGLDQRVPINVAKVVSECVIKLGLNQRQISPKMVEDNMRTFLVEGNLRPLF